MTTADKIGSNTAEAMVIRAGAKGEVHSGEGEIRFSTLPTDVAILWSKFDRQEHILDLEDGSPTMTVYLSALRFKRDVTRPKTLSYHVEFEEIDNPA
jgi:hypothetical protein